MQGNRIESADVISPNLLTTTIAQGEALLAILNKNIDQFKELIKVSSANIKGIQFGDASDVAALKSEIAKLESQINSLTNARKAQKTVLTELERVQDKISFNQSEEGKNLAGLKVQLEQVTKANKEAAKAIYQETDAYKRLSDELNKNIRISKNLLAEKRQLTKEEIAFIQATNKAHDELKAIDESLGQYGRSVGNYSKASNGLRLSMAQIAGELPNAGISLRIFAQSISNNIGPLYESIRRVRQENAELIKQGQPTVSVGKQIAASIFSWQTALLALVTAGTYFITWLTEAKDETDIYAEANNRLTKSIDNVNNALDRKYNRLIKVAEARRQDTFELEKSLLLEKKTTVVLELTKAQEKLTKSEIEYNRLQSGLQGEGVSGKLLYLVPVARQTLKFREKSAKEELDVQKRLVLELMELEKDYQADLEALTIKKVNKDVDDRKKNNDKEVKDLKEHKKKLKQIEIDNGIESDEKQADEQSNFYFKRLQLEVDALEDAKKKEVEATEAANEEIRKNNEQLNKDIQEQDKKTAEEAKKNREESVKTIQASIKLYSSFMDNMDKINNDTINRNIERNQDSLAAQQELAAKGLNNTLAFEQKRAAELERERQEQAEKELRRKKIELYLTAFIEYLKQDPPSAADAKAFGAVALADIVSGSFIEGTESVEKSLGKNKVHNGRDGYLVAVDGKERIFNPEQSQKVGTEISNDTLAELGYLFRTGQLSVPQNQLVFNDKNIVDALYDVKQTIKDSKPEIRLDNLGRVIDTSVSNGMKKVIIHANSRPRI